MTPENTKLLFERHKHIFRGKDLSLRENLMPFGFECGDGWFTLIDELSTTIERFLESQQDEERTAECVRDFIVVQVKEKYGTLRFYTSPTPDVIHWIIDFAEGMSAKICESCGSPGETNEQGWIRTLCQNCKKETS